MPTVAAKIDDELMNALEERVADLEITKSVAIGTALREWLETDRVVTDNHHRDEGAELMRTLILKTISNVDRWDA